ncbi:MAG: hypothetical protein JSV80_03355 [Acidobacteriota bacterium]|nr:MAG: hypothetical protein JSV80_03355 [Acidobacteriota bacterium]
MIFARLLVITLVAGSTPALTAHLSADLQAWLESADDRAAVPVIVQLETSADVPAQYRTLISDLGLPPMRELPQLNS